MLVLTVTIPPDVNQDLETFLSLLTERLLIDRLHQHVRDTHTTATGKKETSCKRSGRFSVVQVVGQAETKTCGRVVFLGGA